MNLRNVGEYNIGLDLGTGSVGWAVTDTEGNLLHFKGKPTWGSRIFPSAETAAGARTNRGQRRRYVRRRWRLNLLQQLFASEMDALDPEFFIRLNQSRLLAEDRAEGHADYRWPLFNANDFTEHNYYERFPTIYHLRAWLMTTPKKADLRLIYLAFHNIVKVRGNFLHQDNPNLSAQNANMEEAVKTLCGALQDWCEEQEIPCSPKPKKIRACLENVGISRREKHDAATSLFGFSKEYEKTMGKALADAFVGYTAQFSHVFLEEADSSKFKLSDDEKAEAYQEQLPDEALPLFEAIKGIYSAFVLSGILSAGDGGPIDSGALQGATGNTISFAKVREYEQYGKDLSLLKELVREYALEEYDRFFRGDLHEDKSGYDPAKAQGYTKYNLKKLSYDDFKKKVKELLGTIAADDPRYISMMEAFEEERFLRRLKTSDNGSIPYQLHLEEMDAIIENQGRFYPFLLDERDKIESLVYFRIPYYVGPLTQKNAATAKGGKDDGKMRFAWTTRKDGKDNEPVYPWNWEEVIDKNAAAESFLMRMTSDCTYLMGEPVLPRCSLLYEEFCVLNELNGAHWSQDGDREHRFTYEDRADMMDELFRKGGVSYEKAADWMRQRGHANVHVSGGQGEKKLESRLSSYIFFCKDIFEVDELPETDVPMVEEIIKWNTLFEDRSILKEEIERKYGDRLNADQIKKICKKRFTGWGKISKKLLCGLKAQTDDGPRSIMDVLREGHPNFDQRSRTMVFMEVLHDSDLGFEKLIDDENKKALSGMGPLSVVDLPGSPALRRTVNQATRIVEEIVGIAGHAPKNIFIENTREDDDVRQKGKRTKRRYDAIKEALATFHRDAAKYAKPEVLKELGRYKHDELDEKLTLYFMQGGKSLYSGKPLELSRLSECQVDHIIPQSYVKDDSFDNKALVLASENQRKTDALLIDPAIRQKMGGYWRALHDAKLMDDKKFNNLMCDNISERRIKGFIARQLVETSQIVKLTRMMLESRFRESDTRILGVKAGLSHELREAQGFVKCREINDFHHAHDALLAAEMGRFLLLRHAGMYDNPVGYAHVVKNFVRSQASQYRRSGQLGTSGFFVSSFLRSGFDKETGEIFKDAWDTEVECARIRKYLDYKQVFISRMPEETSGAFWDATIYSPHAKKGGELAVKRGLDPAKYGGYSREQFAYFFVYEWMDKKGKRAYAFSPVPVRVAASIASNPHALEGALEGFAREEAAANGGEFVRILRPKVYKYQLIEVDGNRLYITGRREARNARQLAFSQDETAAVAELVEGSCDEATIAMVFAALENRLPVQAPLLAARVGIAGMQEHFFQANCEERRKLLLASIAASAAKANVVDTRAVGGSQFSGSINPTYAKLLASPSGITFIDQSVTGMFERRTTIGGL